MELNKQDEKLLQELLKKYKQGIVSGFYPGTNITFTPTSCRDRVISALGSGGGIESIQEGDNITVDNTDPLNPIISTSGDGGSQNLQQVTDEGNTTTNNVITIGGALVASTDEAYSAVAYIGTTDSIPKLYLENLGGGIVTLQAEDITGIKISQLPNYDGTLINTGYINAHTGTATLSSGTVTVSNSSIKSGAKIYVSVNEPNGTVGFISASTMDITSNTSFVINSSSSSDNSIVNYYFINP